MKNISIVIEALLSIIGAIIALLCVYAISWIIVCGIVKLITLLFGLTFSWVTATIIWLIWCAIKTLCDF